MEPEVGTLSITDCIAEKALPFPAGVLVRSFEFFSKNDTIWSKETQLQSYILQKIALI